MEAFVRQASARVVAGAAFDELGVVDDRRPREVMAVGRVQDNNVVRSGAEACLASLLERPFVFGSAEQIGSSLVAVAAAEAAIIPRRPDRLSIRLNAPMAFIASRNAVVTVTGLAEWGE